MTTWHYGFAALVGLGLLALQLRARVGLAAALDSAFDEWIEGWIGPGGRASGPELMGELERLLQTHPKTLLIEALWTVVPVAGVFVTVVNFLTYTPQSHLAGALSVLESLRPLYLGVVLGTGLTLGNAWLSMRAGTYMREIRRRARQRLPRLVDAPLAEAVETIVKATQPLRDALAALGTTGAELAGQARGLAAAGGEFGEAVDQARGGIVLSATALLEQLTAANHEFEARLGGILDALARLHEALERQVAETERRSARPSLWRRLVGRRGRA